MGQAKREHIFLSHKDIGAFKITGLSPFLLFDNDSRLFAVFGLSKTLEIRTFFQPTKSMVAFNENLPASFLG